VPKEKKKMEVRAADLTFFPRAKIARSQQHLTLLRVNKFVFLVANAPYPDTPAERRALAKLRSLRRFQRHRGVEALLHHQLQEKRLQVIENKITTFICEDTNLDVYF